MFRKPQHLQLVEKVRQYTSNLYGSTPPICIAVLSWLLSFEERETLQYASHLYCSMPPICTAVRPPFVRQYFWKNTGGWGHRNVSDSVCDLWGRDFKFLKTPWMAGCPWTPGRWPQPKMPCSVPVFYSNALKGLYLKGLLSKHRSIACPLPLALASDLPCGVCTCKWDLQLPSPVQLWTDFPRPRGWRVTTALGNPFPCATALGNPVPCRKVCFAQKAPLDKPPLRLPDFLE